LFNLFVFDPIRVIADKNKLEFALSELKYGFDLHQEYTKRIYIVRYELDEYLLAENFFEQFELIKTELDFWYYFEQIKPDYWDPGVWTANAMLRKRK